MLQEIEVTGFKSLENFNLRLRPGLNLLIGPNGSGKTNIITFLEFLSHLTETTASKAISRVGGAGLAFNRRNKEFSNQTIKFTIRGQAVAYPFSDETARICQYEYQATLAINKEAGLVIFLEQTIRAAFASKDRKFRRDKSRGHIWDLDLIVKTPQDSAPFIRIFKLNRRRIFYRMVRALQKNAALDQFVINDLEGMNLQEHSLINAVGLIFPQLSSIGREVSWGRAFNIAPSEVRKPEDIGRTAEISHDGSGLAATLYALQNAKNQQFRPRISRIRRLSSETIFVAPDSFDRIVSYTRLVNNEIYDLRVDNDPYDNMLKIIVTMSDENGNYDLPFSTMSDGTVKWITLITAILTNKSIFAVEEPENYLHPLMQKEIVSIVRNSGSIGSTGFALITSHSETLLNAADPKEVIVVEMVGGRTVARQPSNSDLIREEIKRTGFGLGYYYISGALSNE